MSLSDTCVIVLEYVLIFYVYDMCSSLLLNNGECQVHNMTSKS